MKKETVVLGNSFFKCDNAEEEEAVNRFRENMVRDMANDLGVDNSHLSFTELLERVSVEEIHEEGKDKGVKLIVCTK